MHLCNVSGYARNNRADIGFYLGIIRFFVMLPVYVFTDAKPSAHYHQYN